MRATPISASSNTQGRFTQITIST